MAFNVKKRGKLTYYYDGDRPVLSALVTEEQADGDLKIHFAGLTGGTSAKGVLGLDELVSMDPHREVALVFQCWEKWLVEAGIATSLRDIDFRRDACVWGATKIAQYSGRPSRLRGRAGSPAESVCRGVLKLLR